MTVHGLPTQDREEYLTRAELAAELKVHVTTIDRWRADGMPSKPWGPRIRRFLMSEVEKWLEDEGRKRLRAERPIALVPKDKGGER